MFGVLRAMIRTFAVGLAIGVLIAPRPGAETRRLLSEGITRFLDQLFEVAALPPVAPERARTNGHAESPPAKRTTRASTDARASS